MPIKASYVHTNLTGRDWRTLVKFYCEVFGAFPSRPSVISQAIGWIARQSLRNAHLTGLHLRLPGFGTGGPTLEIFSYDEMLQGRLPVANEPGFGHLAFAVEDVEEALRAVQMHGGSSVGEIVTTHVTGVGTLRVVYARDPEGNIVELQKWS